MALSQTRHLSPSPFKISRALRCARGAKSRLRARSMSAAIWVLKKNGNLAPCTTMSLARTTRTFCLPCRS